jgi:hypothetical protein
MAHPLKDYARHVQRAIEGDADYARPNYTWCLNQVIAHLPAVNAEGITGGPAVRDALVARIKPAARKAG